MSDDRLDDILETAYLVLGDPTRRARRAGLRALDRGAVARVIEHGARMTGDAARLSLQVRSLQDLLREADLAARVQRTEEQVSTLLADPARMTIGDLSDLAQALGFRLRVGVEP